MLICICLSNAYFFLKYVCLHYLKDKRKYRTTNSHSKYWPFRRVSKQWKLDTIHETDSTIPEHLIKKEICKRLVLWSMVHPCKHIFFLFAVIATFLKLFLAEQSIELAKWTNRLNIKQSRSLTLLLIFDNFKYTTYLLLLKNYVEQLGICNILNFC